MDTPTNGTTALDRFRLDGDAVLITGGASGIGRAYAECCLEAGADVVIADIDTDRLEETTESLEARFDGDVVALEADVSDEDDVEYAVAKTVSEFGGIDVAFANAGISGRNGVGMPVSRYPIEEWERVISVNLRGVFLTNTIAATAMQDTGDGGRIINTASILGMRASELPGLSPYVASKGGVIQLTRQFAAELGTAGIRVNAIAPGWIKTNLGGGSLQLDDEGPVKDHVVGETCLKRLGDPEDLKGIALFLASDASSYCTGGVYTVDGGWTIT